MNSTPNEKAKEEKGPGTQDPVSSGRSELGQKNERVNYGYENGVSKPDAQRQDGENPDDDGRNKEWQDRARVNLETTHPDIISNIDRDFEKEQEEKKGKDNPYY